MIRWNIEEMTGYKPVTTFYDDFSIADQFGLDAIKDTLDRAFSEWKINYKYFTELVMVLNHKCWEHWHRSQSELKQFREDHAEISKFYKDKYYELLDWGYDNLKGDELRYYIDTLD